MAQTSWPDPADGREIDEIDYEALEGLPGDDGVIGDPTGAAPVYADGSGMQVFVLAGTTGRIRGFGWAAGDEDVPLSIAANSSGSTRLDRVVLRLDRSTWQVRAVILQGTPGAGATVLTQDKGPTGVWEELLATVTVASGASAITAGNVSARLRYLGARPSLVRSGTTVPTPYRGEMAWSADGTVKVWDGTEWRTVYEDTGDVLANATLSGWTNETDTIIRRRSGVVVLRAGTWLRSGTSVGANVDVRLPITIPTTYRPATRAARGLAWITGGSVARVTVYQASDAKAGQVWIVSHTGIGTKETVYGTQITWAV